MSYSRSAVSGASSWDDQEKFNTVLKSVVSATSPFHSSRNVETASLLLGPIGAPLSALVGLAISAITQVYASESNSNSVSAPSTDAISGLTQRAILGEAALQTILDMDSTPLQETGVLASMQTNYISLASDIDFPDLALKLLPIVWKPAFQVAADLLEQEKSRSFADSAEAFSANQMDSESAAKKLDTSFRWYDLFLPAQASMMVQIGTPYAEAGFKKLKEKLQQRFVTKASKAEDYVASADDLAVELLAQRAIMGEAALRALSGLSKEDGRALEEEGCKDKMEETVRKLEMQIVARAPGLVAAAEPLAAEIARES
jgi:hypothetical protein